MSYVASCQSCGSSELVDVLNLGNHAPSNGFLRSSQLNDPETLYPLTLCLCESCSLVQTRHILDARLLFSGFTYLSGTSESFAVHLRELAQRLARMVHLQEGEVVVDIGSGDGTLLEGYKDLGVVAIGVEPSSALCEVAEMKGVKAYNEFFTSRTGTKIAKEYGRAKIVTATNVFAHVSDVHDTLQGILRMMTEDGIFVSESQYLVDLIQDAKYDMIYHEHLRYYSAKSLLQLFRLHGLVIHAVERIATHGGSIRVYAHRTDHGMRTAESVRRLLTLEEGMRLDSRSTFSNFARRVVSHKLQLVSQLTKIALNSRIVGIGAPDKANTLLTFCGIGPEVVEYLTELNPLKIGKYTPHTHIPVVSEETLLRENPRYALLLSWNFAEDISQKLRAKGFSGKIIVPFPDLKVLS